MDSWFVQATAWYLKLDLWIVDCASRDDHPFIRISGNLENPDIPCNGPIITLGTKSSCHYQSLLPVEMLHMPHESIPEYETKNMSHAAEGKQKNPSKTDAKNPEKSHDKKTPTNEMPNYVKENPPDKPEANQEPDVNIKETLRAAETNQNDTEQHYKEEDLKNYAPFMS